MIGSTCGVRHAMCYGPNVPIAMGLYGKAPLKRGTFFRLQVYERVGISRAEV